MIALTSLGKQLPPNPLCLVTLLCESFILKSDTIALRTFSGFIPDAMQKSCTWLKKETLVAKKAFLKYFAKISS